MDEEKFQEKEKTIQKLSRGGVFLVIFGVGVLLVMIGLKVKFPMLICNGLAVLSLGSILLGGMLFALTWLTEIKWAYQQKQHLLFWLLIILGILSALWWSF